MSDQEQTNEQVKALERRVVELEAIIKLNTTFAEMLENLDNIKHKIKRCEEDINSYNSNADRHKYINAYRNIKDELEEIDQYNRDNFNFEHIWDDLSRLRKKFYA